MPLATFIAISFFALTGQDGPNGRAPIALPYKEPPVKSLQLANLGLSDDPHYSDLQVMQSPAGHYIGTSYRNLDRNGRLLFEEPGSRDSGYFANREEAEAFLAELEANQHDLANCEAAAELRLEP